MTTICSPDDKQKTLQSKILTFCITFQHVNSTFYLNRKNVCKLIPQQQNNCSPEYSLLITCTVKYSYLKLSVTSPCTFGQDLEL